MNEEVKILGYLEIPPSKPYLREKDKERIMAVLDSGMIAYGRETGRFEEELSRYLGLAGGVATNQGMSALHIALEALGIEAGDEVIVPSYVCSSVHRAIELSGARPVLADAEPCGYNLDPQSAEGKITHRTKGIVLPHMFGTPGDIDSFLEIADNYGLYLIEDCAQSLGAEYKGERAGSFGNAAVCSFKATKVIAAGEGGMALFASKKDADRCRDLVTTDKRPCGYGWFYGYLMPDLAAALGRSQLEDVDDFVIKRKNIANRYDEVFESLGVEPLKATNQKDSIYFRYVLAVDDPDAIIDEMKKYGIYCGRPVNLPVHRDENFQGLYEVDAEGFPNSDRAYRNIIFIPLYPAMTEEMVNHVCSSIEKVWRG